MVEPHHSHWIGAKNLLRYLQGTITHGLRYTAGDGGCMVILMLIVQAVWWIARALLGAVLFGFCFDILDE